MRTLTLRKASVAAGMKMARFVFGKRGNRSEAHLSETELASLLALAYEQGFKMAAQRGELTPFGAGYIEWLEQKLKAP